MIQPDQRNRLDQRKHGVRPHHFAGVVALVALVIVAFVVLSGVVAVVFRVIELAIVIGIVLLLARFFLRRSRS
jgi:hypothetical protein